MAQPLHTARAAAVALALLAVVHPSPARAFGPFPQVLQPKEYASPSGEYRLRVDPSNRYGRGKAAYRLTCNGAEVWSGDRPFTLWDAAVADDGSAGGYAYSQEPAVMWEAGDFRVVLLDPRGTVRLDHVTKRTPSRFLHTPANPLADGLIFDPPNDRLIVRVNDSDSSRGSEAWWVFRLSTAKPDGTFEPKTRMPDTDPVRHVIDARAIPGTPLMLVHWWRYDGTLSEPGARFTLIDLTGKPVWTLDLPRDYSRPREEKAQDVIRDEIRRAGAILDATQPGRFDLRFAADAKRVTFTVRRGMGEAWDVRETGRKPYAPPPATAEKLPDVPELSLKPLGAVTLRPVGQKPSGAIRDVLEFVVDGAGRLAFLRRESGTGGATFVLVGPTGSVAREVRLPDPEKKSEWPDSTLLAWVGADRFLFTRSPTGVGAKAAAWWIDGMTGKVTAIEGFDCPAIDKLAGCSDGRFVALATEWSKHTLVTTAYLFDAKGRLAQRLRQGYQLTPGVLFSPKDIAVTSDGNVAVLDVIRKDVTLFSGDGKYLRTIDLAKAWGRQPNYPSDLTADTDGGLVVGDFNGRSPVVRMKADGTVRQELTAKYPDGRTSAGLQLVRVAPDGRLWASDGHALARLDGTGVVDQVFGEPPDPSQLGDAAAVALDGRCRVYVASARSGAVHVFDPSGKPLHVCRPDPTDFGAGPVRPDLTVADTGDVYLTAFERAGEFLHFSPDGKRLGLERFGETGLGALAVRWVPRPGGVGRWVHDLDTLRLVDRKGEVTRVIERQPDGDWLAMIQRGAVAPDGSLAVLAGLSFGGQGVNTVHLYDKAGGPVRSFRLPPSVDAATPLVYDGERVAVWGGGRVVLVGAAGRPVGQIRPPQAPGGTANWHPLLPAGRGELWLYDGRLTLHRYALP